MLGVEYLCKGAFYSLLATTQRNLITYIQKAKNLFFSLKKLAECSNFGNKILRWSCMNHQNTKNFAAKECFCSEYIMFEYILKSEVEAMTKWFNYVFNFKSVFSIQIGENYNIIAANSGNFTVFAENSNHSQSLHNWRSRLLEVCLILYHPIPATYNTTSKMKFQISARHPWTDQTPDTALQHSHLASIKYFHNYFDGEWIISSG